MRIERAHTVTSDRVGEPRRVRPSQLSPDTKAMVGLSDRGHLVLPGARLHEPGRHRGQRSARSLHCDVQPDRSESRSADELDGSTSAARARRRRSRSSCRAGSRPPGSRRAAHRGRPTGWRSIPPACRQRPALALCRDRRAHTQGTRSSCAATLVVCGWTCRDLGPCALLALGVVDHSDQCSGAARSALTAHSEAGSPFGANPRSASARSRSQFMTSCVTFPWRISNRLAVAGAPARVGGGPSLAGGAFASRAQRPSAFHPRWRRSRRASPDPR
jgi:hypothetical protein